jgi:hypothetical protein
MAKPILVVNYCVEGLPWELVINNIKSLQEVIENSGANEEYHTFVLPVQGDSHVQVFYDKDLDEDGFFNIRDLIDEKLDEFAGTHKVDDQKIMEELGKFANELISTKKWWQFWK